MSRIVKAPEVRRQELIEIALRQFMKNGYEKTSIRSILKEADGEIGMFYHYFESKNEIYEAALEKYNEDFIVSLTEVINASTLDYQEKLNKIFSCISFSISEYSLMHSQKANPDIMTILLSRTLLKMVPLVELLIIDGVEKNVMRKPIENTHLLSQFLLFGVSAILHDVKVSSMEEKISCIKMLLHKTLDFKIDRNE